MYAYAGNSPWMNVDITGLDTAVVYGDGILSNPFGHAAVGLTGQGIFSLGTGTPLGSSFTNYLNKQSNYRNSTVLELKTTPEQEVCIANYMNSHSSKLPDVGLKAMCDNCASRVGDALVNCGAISSHVPKILRCLPGDLSVSVSAKAFKITPIPKGSSFGTAFDSYNPK
jgi:hypothetical protein